MDTIVLAIIGSGILSGALSTLITVIANTVRDRNGIRAGVRMSLYYQFRDHALAAIRDGEVDANDLQILQDTYDIYKRLGGDGYFDNLMNKCQSLVITQTGVNHGN